MDDGLILEFLSDDQEESVTGSAVTIEAHQIGAHGMPIHAVSSTERGQIAVTASWDRRAKIWHTPTREMVREINDESHMLMGCAISRDGNRVATASMDGALRLRNVITDESVATLRSQNRQLNYAFDCWMSDDGSLVACAYSHSGRNSEIVFFDWTATGVPYRRKFVHLPYRVRRLSVSIRRKLIAFTTLHRGKREAIVLDFDSFEELRRMQLSDSKDNQWDAHICCAKNENSVVVADNEKLVVVHPRGMEFDQELTGYVPPEQETPCWITPDGLRVISFTGSNQLGIWCVRTNQIIVKFADHRAMPICCTISDDFSTAFAGLIDGTLLMYDLSNVTQEQTFLSNSAVVCRVFESEVARKRMEEKLEIDATVSSLQREQNVMRSKMQMHGDEISKYLRRFQIIEEVSGEIRDKIFQSESTTSNDLEHQPSEASAATSLTPLSSQRKMSIVLDLAKIMGITKSCKDENMRDSLNRGGVECVICLEKIEDGDEVVRLECLHVFHKHCTIPYLKRQYNPFCPIDRTPVDPENVDNLPIWFWNES